MISLSIYSLSSNEGISLVLKMTLLIALKSTSKSNITCSFDTNILLAIFFNIIEIPHFYLCRRYWFLIAKLINEIFINDKTKLPSYFPIVLNVSY